MIGVLEIDILYTNQGIKVMKSLLIALFFMLPPAAYADNFLCVLRVNSDDLAVGEAPDYGREVRVDLGNYRCEGVIDKELVVTTTLTNVPMNSYGQAGGRASATVYRVTYNPITDREDVVICKCGLN